MNTIRCALVVLAMAGSCMAETAYFICSGPASWYDGARFTHRNAETYVAPVSDSDLIHTIREFLDRRARGLESRPMVLQTRFAAGSDGINRNHAVADRPLWDWHVAEVLAATRTSGDAIDASYQLWRDGAPSDMGRYVRGDLDSALDRVHRPMANLLYYPVQMELRLGGVAPQVTNVSCRGSISAAEPQLIAGFVVSGDMPRNVIVRVLGPSLAAFGVSAPLADPKLSVYLGAKLIAANDSWTTANLNLARAPGADPAVPGPLAPALAAEPGLRLSLEPGAYTVVATGAASGTGVALIEVYGVD